MIVANYCHVDRSYKAISKVLIFHRRMKYDWVCSTYNNNTADVINIMHKVDHYQVMRRFKVKDFNYGNY